MIDEKIKEAISFVKKASIKKKEIEEYVWLFNLEFKEVEQKEFKEEGRYINSGIIRNFYVQGKVLKQVSIKELKKQNACLEYKLSKETKEEEIEKYLKEYVTENKTKEIFYCKENKKYLTKIKQKKEASKQYEEIFNSILSKLTEIEKNIEDIDEEYLEENNIDDLLEELESELFE